MSRLQQQKNLKDQVFLVRWWTFVSLYYLWSSKCLYECCGLYRRRALGSAHPSGSSYPRIANYNEGQKYKKQQTVGFD